MDLHDLAALRLQIEWGADEALLDTPQDRFATPPGQTPIQAPVLTQGPAQPQPTPQPRPRAATLVPLATGPGLAVQAAIAAAAAAPDLAALHAAMDAFHASPLRGTATTTVAPSGNPAAGLVFIADAPGPDDDRAGQAFSGPPGQRLDRILGTAGLTRNDLLLTLMVPWRPPGGRPASEPELALCLPFLHRLLTLARPTRIVLMGATPYRTLIGEDPTFRKARGQWTTLAIPGLDPIPTLPILAPDLWLGTPVNKRTTWDDLLTLRTTLSI